MKHFKTFLILAALLTAFSAVGFCTTANATFAFAGFGGVSFVGGSSIESATSIDLAPLTEVAFVPPTYRGIPNDFLGVIGIADTVTVNPLTITIANGAVSIPDFLVWGPAGRFTFSATSLLASSSGSGFLDLDYQGIFHDNTGAYVDNAGELKINFSQPAGGAVSEAGSFATPPVPEPATMLLLGSSLLGLGFIRRRKA